VAWAVGGNGAAVGSGDPRGEGEAKGIQPSKLVVALTVAIESSSDRR
jgi:hypothetical protein